MWPVMKQFWLILAAVLGLAATSVPASADLLFTLNQGGGAFSTPGNYGTVRLHQNGTGATAYVTVTVQLASGATFAGTDAGYAIAWDIRSSSGCSGNACYPGPTLSSVTVTSANSANFTPTQTNASGDQNIKATPFTGGKCTQSGANCFEYGIDYKIGGSKGTDNKLIFDVKKTGGLVLTDFIANQNGYRFAVDIAFNHKTGNVAAKGDGVRVPEPQTWLLFIAGLAVLPLLQRRRRLARAT